ncbi:hypothetical protein F4806DRAFT_503749 [Annulohypoxylon nitens]|nr:hypothetical protein F4806DRAFT_503749 [Annulohypoxylon nitens]
MSTPQPLDDPARFFILIGIPSYKPKNECNNPSIDYGHYKLSRLGGASTDIERLEEYIHQQRYRKAQIFKLTSSESPEGMSPRERENQLPTYDNIVNLFKKVASQVEKAGGGIVHIHFSCHGIRVQTRYPQLKGAEGKDEAIAPYDLREKGQPLRDVELAILISSFTRNGAKVSLFCDCCHAGSVSRGDDGDEEDSCEEPEGEDLPSRGFGEGMLRYPIPIPSNDLSLRNSLREVWNPEFSDLSRNNEWMIKPVGYEFFGACCLDAETGEDIFDGKCGGVYTHTLLQALKEANEQRQVPMSGQIHERIVSIFKRSGRKQTPVFAGNKKRHWWTTSEGSDILSLSVISVTPEGPQSPYVTLSEGYAQGITEGSTYAIYPWHETDTTDISTRPRVQVFKLGQTTSRARWMNIHDMIDGDVIEKGLQAVLVRYELDNIKIKLNSPSAPQEDISRKYREFGDLLRENQNMLDVAETEESGDPSGTTFYVGVNIQRQYHLEYLRSKQIIHFPLFPVHQDKDVFFSYLTHLSRFEALKRLSNPFHPDRLRKCLKIEIEGRDIMEYCAWDASQVEDRPVFELRATREREIASKFTNTTCQSLSVTGLNFSSRWGVNIFYPCEEEEFATIPKNETINTTWQLEPPPQVDPADPDHAIEYVKFFVSEEDCKIHTFKSVCMKELLIDNQQVDGETRGEAQKWEGSLDSLLSRLGAQDRGFNASKGTSPPTWPWITFMFRLRTIRG